MRKVGAAALAIPVLAALYLASLTRRNVRGRAAALAGAIAIVGLVLVTSLPPARGTAAPRSEAPRPIAAEMLNPVRTGHGLVAPFTVRFAAAMDAASVAAALRISPDTAFELDWDASGTTLTIAPLEHWNPDSLYTVTIGAAARSTDGAVLASPVRSVALTAAGGSSWISATRTHRALARTDTAFRITLDRSVAPAVLRSAIRTDPYVEGTLTAGATTGTYLFTPSEALDPDKTYRIWLEGLVDDLGVPFATAASIDMTTAPAPAVVRFRPRDETRKVERAAAISVRFTERMARRATEAAFRVTANGKAVKGTYGWAEKDTVLVFVPSARLPYAAKVVMRVEASATSRAGEPLAKAGEGTFVVEPKPKPRPKAAPTRSIPRSSGGGGAVSGSWRSVELYYLKLMNCTRTGGWVTSTGSCKSPGGRNVAPLALSSGISSRVSRPYAKLLATRGLCDHFIGGNPGDRLRRAGYTSYRWAENLGCRSGNPYSAVLGSHLFFQSEKSYNGGHYRNLMNAAYDRAGIGVWVSSGRVRLVVDFYHP